MFPVAELDSYGRFYCLILLREHVTGFDVFIMSSRLFTFSRSPNSFTCVATLVISKDRNFLHSTVIFLWWYFAIYQRLLLTAPHQLHSSTSRSL